MEHSKDLRLQTAQEVKCLVGWAATALAEPRTDTLRRKAAWVLADDLGSIICATSEPQVRDALRAFQRNSGSGQATVFTRGAPRLDRVSAAAANGMAVTWCELDEGYRSVSCHSGSYVLPALLAEAESQDIPIPVGTLLDAIVVAYEVTTRFARAFSFEPKVHPHAAFAAIGAAAGVSILRRHDEDKLLGSLTNAASMAFAGPFQHAMDGALVRNAWTSAGAWLGLQSVEWAEVGITGIAETPYDIFVQGMNARVIPELLTENLGKDWAIAENFHKVYACCQQLHSAIEASLELYQTSRSQNKDPLKRIIVETHAGGMTMTTANHGTSLGAKFSMQHAMAAVAVLGTADQTAFDESSLQNEAIKKLRDVVEVRPLAKVGPPPNDRPARVTWVFYDGSNATAQCDSARGGPDRPFDEVDLFNKIDNNVRSSFPAMMPELVHIISLSAPQLQNSWHDTVIAMTR